MKIISISGVIGWDATPKDIRKQLEDANGEDLEIQVSSPGGLVYDGLEIYNLIKRYPGIVTTHLMGLAASMASYIVMAGERVIAEENAVFMVHNARAFAAGDHNTLRQAANIIEGLSRIIANSYIKKTGKTREQIQAMMDEETFLYGDEILDAGFIDEIVEAPESEEIDDDKVALIAKARMQIDQCDKQVRETENLDSLSQIAAILGDMESPQDPYPNEHSARVREPGDFQAKSFRRKNIETGIDIIIGRLKGESTMTTQAYRFSVEKFTVAQAKKWLKDHKIKYIKFEPATKKEKSLGVADEAAEAAISNIGEIKDMTLDELKKENPALYAEIFEAGRKEGEADGIKQERERVLALIGWKEADAENEKVASIVAEALASGKTEEEVKPQLSVAVRDFGKGAGKDGENPPNVSTAASSTGAGAGDGFTAEDHAAAEKAGLSAEDLKKYGPKKEGGK